MPEEFQNDKIQLTVNRKPDCIVELTIIANPAFGQESYKKALKNVSKEVSFPGFRKGRAPDTMVESQYGPQIDREFKEIFLNESVKQALDLCELYPWNRSEKIKADMDEASVEKGGKFTVTFESFPEIPDINPADITIEKIEPKKITDEDVEKHINALRYHHSEWKEVSDRPCEENDRIEVTVEGVDDEEPQKRQSEFQLDKNIIEEWLFDLMIGKKVGDSEETTPPNEQGDPKKVKITIDKIKAAELKELDEEFVKTFGTESVEDFTKKIQEFLARQEEEKIENLTHQAIEQILTTDYSFDVPASLIDQERHGILTDMVEHLKRSGLSDEQLKAEKDEMEATALKQALHNLRNHYILLKIAEDQKFNISREEITNELIKGSVQPDGTLNMEMVNNPEQYAAPIMRRLQLIKAMEYLAENVTIK